MIDLALAGTTFGVIFVAELPDKTALAALVLATKHAPFPVFLGSASALTIQSLVAIAAGHLLGMLPARPVHIGTGLLFLISAVVMWRRRGDDEETRETPDRPTFLRSFAQTFAVVFLAEWGDLTQLGTAALSARFGEPLTIFGAATLALWAVAGLAVFAGNRAARLLHPVITQRVAAIVFALLGALLVTGIV